MALWFAQLEVTLLPCQIQIQVLNSRKEGNERGNKTAYARYHHSIIMSVFKYAHAQFLEEEARERSRESTKVRGKTRRTANRRPVKDSLGLALAT